MSLFTMLISSMMTHTSFFSCTFFPSLSLSLRLTCWLPCLKLKVEERVWPPMPLAAVPVKAVFRT